MKSLIVLISFLSFSLTLSASYCNVQVGFVCSETQDEGIFQRELGCIGWGTEIWDINEEDKALRFLSLESCEKFQWENKCEIAEVINAPKFCAEVGGLWAGREAQCLLCTITE